MGNASQKMATLMMLMALITSSKAAKMEEKEKECSTEMGNLASCIPFVSGTAVKPTAQCCEETKKVKENKPECLCVMIKESTDPSLGLPVNTTLALQMPLACHIDAKVSDCPSLLNLPENSPEAKIFKDAIEGSSSPISTSSSSPPSGSNSKTTTATPSNNEASDAIKATEQSLFSFIITIAVFGAFM
ncbi:PREDICTED: protein YLS3-like [Tarenaya hassleriana]|uniref:protein YLS3-like n=1 Tax=Tarenaya hassleriana TaxID=28532 RepID=UPI00053C41BC|nr:PREDICTED: protein YLS3-like [Tarenaya hassleriana]